MSLIETLQNTEIATTILNIPNMFSYILDQGKMFTYYELSVAGQGNALNIFLVLFIFMAVFINLSHLRIGSSSQKFFSKKEKAHQSISLFLLGFVFYLTLSFFG